MECGREREEETILLFAWGNADMERVMTIRVNRIWLKENGHLQVKASGDIATAKNGPNNSWNFSLSLAMRF